VAYLENDLKGSRDDKEKLKFKLDSANEGLSANLETYK
jgi:hypothetical protein